MLDLFEAYFVVQFTSSNLLIMVFFLQEKRRMAALLHMEKKERCMPHEREV